MLTNFIRFCAKGFKGLKVQFDCLFFCNISIFNDLII